VLATATVPASDAITTARLLVIQRRARLAREATGEEAGVEPAASAEGVLRCEAAAAGAPANGCAGVGCCFVIPQRLGVDRVSSKSASVATCDGL
jgi:hypothetical protein